MNKRFKIFVSFVLVLGAVLLIANSVSAKVFDKKISLSQVSCVSESEIKKTLNLDQDIFFRINKDQKLKTLQSKYPCVGDLNFKYSLPKKIDVQISGRQAVAALHKIDISMNEGTASSNSSEFDLMHKDSTESGTFFLVDQTGYIFSSTESATVLPLIKMVGVDLDIKKMIMQNVVQNTLFLMQKLKNLGIDTSNVMVLDQALYVDGQPKLKFTLKNDLDRQVASLQLILQKAKMRLDPSSTDTRLGQDLRTLEMIDLRFDKPVIIYSSIKK